MELRLFFNMVMLLCAMVSPSAGCGRKGKQPDTCYAPPLAIWGPRCSSRYSLIGSRSTYITYSVTVKGKTTVFCEALACGPVGSTCCTGWGWYPIGKVGGGGATLPWGNSAGTPAIRCRGLPLGSALHWTWTPKQGRLITQCPTTTTATTTSGTGTNPQDPDQPSDPKQPEQPREPSEPKQPSEPSQPSNPEEPSDPNQPTEQPADPRNPSNPNNPSEPGEPTEPSDGDDGTKAGGPTEPSEGGDDGADGDTTIPTQPTESTEPTVPSEGDEGTDETTGHPGVGVPSRPDWLPVDGSWRRPTSI